MAVQNENVEQLMRWLADGSDVRSAHAGADALVEGLAALVFQGDAGWPDHTDRVDAYRALLAGWFADDGARTSQFDGLTQPGADPGTLIDWFSQVVRDWEQRSAHTETGTGTHTDTGTAGAAGDAGGGTAAGSPNPNSDGTPGTEYYRYEEATGDYLYAATADSTDWATYEARRYSERVSDDSYGLDYRLDRTHQVYEWYDEAAATWRDQAWADQHAARGGAGAPATAAQPADGVAAPEWDAKWAVFYRVGPGGEYEFADAVTPGDQSSGCSGRWLSQEQAAARDATAAPEIVQLQEEIRATVKSALKKDRPQLDASFSDADIDAIVANLTKEALGY